MDFMQEAIKEANYSLKIGEVPVGAVIVKNNKIISKAHNLKRK
jgi:tRNA(adenine34) deaminase